MSIKGVLYIDKKGREILYAPKVFVVINYTRREPEVILEPRRLEKWYENWKKGKVSLKSIIDWVDIDEKDIELVTEHCFNNKIDEAKWWCVGIFDQVINKVYDIN